MLIIKCRKGMYLINMEVCNINKNNMEELRNKMYEVIECINECFDEEKESERYEIKAGDVFLYNGLEFVCLGTSENKLFAITKNIVATDVFCDDVSGDYCNVWTKSPIRKWLNTDFLNKYFDKGDLYIQRVDLTADNGDDAYGKCEDYITLLNCDQYRKYRKLIPTYDDIIWTVTPWVCNTISIRTISPTKVINNSYVSSSLRVAPICLFNLYQLTAHRQANVITLKRVE